LAIYSDSILQLSKIRVKPNSYLLFFYTFTTNCPVASDDDDDDDDDVDDDDNDDDDDDNDYDYDDDDDYDDNHDTFIKLIYSLFFRFETHDQ
jgi:hypothetical protein